MAAIPLALVAADAAAQVTPFVPDEWRFGRRQDEGSLRYCLDPRDPEWNIARDIGKAIAGALLIRPDPVTLSDSRMTAGWDTLYQHLLSDCDLYFGLKLIPNGYPDWLTLTRSYYEASYVFAVTSDAWDSLTDIPRSKALATAIGTTADFALINYLETLPADRRWERFPKGDTKGALKALSRGEVAAALVWGPAAWAAQQEDSAYAGLRYIAPDPLSTSTLGVGAALLANESFLRSNVDQAIAALSADGTIAAILKEHDFPAQVVR